MSRIKKEVRVKVWHKYGKKCAYCGKDLEYKKMQVDHIEPYWHTVSHKDQEKNRIKKGAHHIDNFNPSCARCNKRKDRFSLETFREEIKLQTMRLRRDSSSYRMALDYGLIEETGITVEFWFEKYKRLAEG